MENLMIRVLRKRVEAVKAASVFDKGAAAEAMAESLLAWATDVENRLAALEAQK